MSNSNFSISGTSINSTLYKGKSREFNFLVDEPNELGGQDLGANPVEYLLAAYAGCLNVVINIVAKEQNIKIDEIKINIDGDVDPSKLLGISDKNRAGFQSLNVDIDFKTDESKEKIDLLFNDVKQRCPINDNLSNPLPIDYDVKTTASETVANA